MIYATSLKKTEDKVGTVAKEVAPQISDSEIKSKLKQPDMVNQPPHYTFGKHEVIDVIEDFKLPYALGNCVKYIARAGKKNNALEDLKKAEWYLNRYQTHTLNVVTHAQVFQQDNEKILAILNDWDLKPDLNYCLKNILDSQSYSLTNRKTLIETAKCYLERYISVLSSQL